MNDDLPEIFDQLKPPAAPPTLRPRVLAAVNSELSNRRKPRWERVLELTVAASFVLGVGLNADLLVGGVRQLVNRGANQTLDDQSYVAAPARQSRRDEDLTFPRAGLFDEDYAKFLAQLSEPPAG